MLVPKWHAHVRRPIYILTLPGTNQSLQAKGRLSRNRKQKNSIFGTVGFHSAEVKLLPIYNTNQNTSPNSEVFQSSSHTLGNIVHYFLYIL